MRLIMLSSASQAFPRLFQAMGFYTTNFSPHYSQSNGKAEATVKSKKRIIAISWSTRTLNEDKLCCAVLQYRNTPSHKDGLSPTQQTALPPDNQYAIINQSRGSSRSFIGHSTYQLPYLLYMHGRLVGRCRKL